MIVRYVGPAAEVIVAATGQKAARNGDPIEVLDVLGASLVEQADAWVEVKPTTKAVKAATVEES